MSDSFDKTPEDVAAGRRPASGTDAGVGEPGIDYPSMVQNALRRVVRDALAQVAAEGLPGEHHVYISFRTGHGGVGLSEALRAQYPDEMTIVLQHDYRDLEVDDVGFDVTLRFGGIPQSLRIPFEALTSFFDPSVHFMLRFDAGDDEDAELDEELFADRDAESDVRIFTDVLRDADAASAAFRPKAVPAPEADDEDAPAGEVVSFEAFRKK